MEEFPQPHPFTSDSRLASSLAATAGNPAPEPAGLRKRILIMDDEDSILELISRMLASQGYEIETATNGNAAVAQYWTALEAGRRFDAVIFDLTVPQGMGGFEAFQAILALDPEVKAILSSGYSHEPVVLNYKKYGIAGVAPKPYKVRDLLGTVESVLR